MMKTVNFLLGLLFMTACSGVKYKQTETPVDLSRYLGTWYVWTGRTTFVESGAHDAVEKYAWNTDKKRIDIDFSFHRDATNGKLKRLPQKAWIVEGTGNARWKISPFWPLRFDYLILAFDPDYEWTAVGVPSGSYLWIMGKHPAVSDAKLAEIVALVRNTGYPVQNLQRVPQN
jgi:apolipoprotein D and lipocalin family protein